MGRAMKKTGKQLFVVSLLCWGSLAQAQLKPNDITTANTLFTDYACTGCHDFADTLVDVREGLKDWLDAGFNM